MCSIRCFLVKLTLSLKSIYTTSNGSRKRRVLKLRWYSLWLQNSLCYRKISHGGRSTNTGKIVVYSKGSFKKRVKLVNIRYSTRFIDPMLLVSITFVPLVNKLVNLLISDSGTYFYFPSVLKSRMFTFTTLRSSFTRKFTPFDWNFVSFLCRLKPFKKISNLELTPGQGIQYARSAGSHGKMLTLNFTRHVTLVKLPSGVKKYFSIYSIAVSDACTLQVKKKLSIRQSGFFQCLGSKAKVRGVAKNPVDHPHGGRTKSIKYPRTPWGKTTKFK